MLNQQTASGRNGLDRLDRYASARVAVDVTQPADTLNAFMASLGHAPAPVQLPSLAMAPSTSPFWTSFVHRMRDKQDRIEIACGGMGVAMMVMIAGRVAVAWIGGAL